MEGDAMTLKRPSFTPTRTDEERAAAGYRVLSIRLNSEELRLLEEDARILEQEKPATVLKFLALLGHNLLHSELAGLVLRTYIDNLRKNRRVGISIADPKFKP